MTDDLAIYTNCRKALGCSLADVIRSARARRITAADVEAAFARSLTRDEALLALKSIGLTLEDIAGLVGLTRERVRQILAGMTDEKIKSASKPTAKTVELGDARRQRLIRRMATEPGLWNERGRAKTSVLADELMLEGYNQAQARTLVQQIAKVEAGFKARLLIEIHFNVPADQHFAWINDQLQTCTLTHILDRINRTSPVPLSLMALDVYARGLGIKMTPGAPGISRSVDSSHVF